jgi:hypothetical protein
MRSSSPTIGSSASIAAEKSCRSNVAKARTLPAHKGRMDNPLALELLHLPFAHLQGRVIAGHGLRLTGLYVGVPRG